MSARNGCDRPFSAFPPCWSETKRGLDAFSPAPANSPIQAKDYFAMRLMPLATAVALSALLAACQGVGSRPAVGPAASGQPGDAVTAPSGAVVGGLVSGDIGRNLDDADRTAA